MNAGAPADIDYLEAPGAGPGIPDLSKPPPSGGQPPPPPPPGQEIELSAFPGWEQATVEQFLEGAGHGLHMLIGVSEQDWQMTRTDLDRIAPPLTRILNRWEPAVRASPYADPILVAYGFGLYGWRSALQRQRALRDMARAEQELDRYERPTAQPSPAQSSARVRFPTADEQPAGENGAGPAQHVTPDDVEFGGTPRYFDTGGSTNE